MYSALWENNIGGEKKKQKISKNNQKVELKKFELLIER